MYNCSVCGSPTSRKGKLNTCDPTRQLAKESGITRERAVRLLSMGGERESIKIRKPLDWNNQVKTYIPLTGERDG